MVQTYRLIKHVCITLPSTHELIVKAGGQCSGRNKTNPTEEVMRPMTGGEEEPVLTPRGPHYHRDSCGKSPSSSLQ